MVLSKVFGDKHSDFSVGSYPVLLDQNALAHDTDNADTQRGSFVVGGSKCSPFSMGFPDDI